MSIHFYIQGHTGDPFAAIADRLDTLTEEVHKMALDQATFDQELGDLVSAIDQLITAVDSLPPADLTAEGQAVTDAAERVRAELDKIAPAPPATA